MLHNSVGITLGLTTPDVCIPTKLPEMMFALSGFLLHG